MDLTEVGQQGCGQDTCESGHESVTGSCEHGNEHFWFSHRIISSAPAIVSEVLRSGDPVTEASFDFNARPYPLTDRHKDISLRTSENSHPSKSF